MAKSLEQRVAHLERFNDRLLTALGKHFHIALEPDEEPAEPSFDTMTKAQLVEYAEVNSIPIDTSWTKAYIIAAIEAAKAPATGK